MKKEHTSKQSLYDALEAQRDWVPFTPKPTFCKWVTRRSGVKDYAKDHGYSAWPLHDAKIRSAPVAEPRAERRRYAPVESEYRLRGGFKAGQRVHHRDRGAGIILLIDEHRTIFQFEQSLTLTEEPTARAHQYLTEVIEQ